MITRRSLFTIMILAAGLTAGYLISRFVIGFLEISFTEKKLQDLTPSAEAPGIGLAETETGTVSADTVRFAIPLRMVDMGGVGIVPDTANWGDNYEHNQHYFEEVILAYPPYIDTGAFRREKGKLERYASLMASYGYNAISFPWFLEFINFNSLGNGKQVYGDGSLYRQRHDTLSQRFGELMQIASDTGLGPYLWTDMVALTPPLKRYFQRTFGSMDTEDPLFWEVYRMAAEEAFEKFPHVKGIIIRIGEAGAIYNKPGWDYTSELYVRTEKAVQMMLDAFLEAAEKFNREIIFRTWSIGVGNIGDMHTSPETYDRVIGNIQSDHLVVSTKYCSGDFYSWLPLNPTLFHGEQRRIAEIQTKREFEGFGAIPNYIAPLHQAAIQSFLERNPNFEGVWTWTQNGGPLRAGPLIIYPFYGFNVINDVNVFAAGRLIQDPYSETDSITLQWIRHTFGSDSLLQSNLLEFLNNSHEVMRKGMYISEFARYDTRALGLEPPPMLWIFEWDIPVASSAVLSNIYYITRNRFRSVIDEGFEAMKQANEQKERLLEAYDRVEQNRDAYDQLIDAADYEIELFRLLDYYRRFFMHYYRWIDTGDAQAKTRYMLAMGQFRAVMEYHIEKYGDDLNTLGMEFGEVEMGIRTAERNASSIRWSRLVLVVTIFLLLLGIPGFVRDRAHMKYAGSLFFDAILRPHLVTSLQAYHNTGSLVLLLPVLYLFGLAAFSSFSSLLFPLCLGTLGLFYVLLLAGLINRRGDYSKILIALMAPKMLILSFLLLFTAIRGPGYFWYQMWVSDIFKVIFFSLYVLLLFRKFQVFVVMGRKWGDLNGMGSAALVCMVLGLQMLIAGVILQFFGLEESLSALNNELLVLPGGLSKILGITTHLGIPAALPVWIICFSGSLTFVSFIIFLFNRKRI